MRWHPTRALRKVRNFFDRQWRGAALDVSPRDSPPLDSAEPPRALDLRRLQAERERALEAQRAQGEGEPGQP